MSSAMNALPPSPPAPALHRLEWRPEGAPRGAVLLLHGMESHAGWFKPLGTRLARDGWLVQAFDRPGWGKSPGPRGFLSSYRDVVEQVAAIASELREQCDAVHLAGMSWGGMAALYLGLRRGWIFDSVALLAPGIAARKDIKFSGAFKVAAEFFHPDPERSVTPVFETTHFTADPEWRRFIDADPGRLHGVSASFCVETLKMRRFIRENAGRRLLPPALCLLAGDDAIINNEKTGGVCAKAGAIVETIPGAAHTLIFEAPDAVAARLSRHFSDSAASLTQGRGRRRRVWVVGAGAVGGAVGALLSFAGHEVGMVVKQPYCPALRANGIEIRTGAARRTTPRTMRFSADHSGLPESPDLIVVAVKSYDTRSALAALAGHVPETAVFASLQNGVDNDTVLAELFPANPIASSAICGSLEMSAPGRIVMADDRGGFGGAFRTGTENRVERVWRDVFAATGLETRWYSGPAAAERVKWSKLMLNIGFNALNSITGKPASALLANPEDGSLAVRAIREGFRAMKELSLEPLDLPGYPVSRMRFLHPVPVAWARTIMSWQASRSAEAAFSMRQDVVNKRQHTEIKELNGKIIEMGNRFGFSVDANRRIVEMMSSFLEKIKKATD